MGRGLSDLQKQILTMAYEDYLKPEKYVDWDNGTVINNYDEMREYVKQRQESGEARFCKMHAEKCNKSPNISTAEALEALFNEKTTATRVSTSRAITRLIKRGLLKYGKFHDFAFFEKRRWGYYLTSEGIEAAKELTVNNPYNVSNINQ